MTLRHRAETGEGQHVDVSLLDTVLFQTNGFPTLAAMGHPLPRLGSEVEPAGPVNTFACADGHVYLAVVLDWFSRRVLSWRVSITMEAAFCVETLEDALARHGKPDIFNTDQGSQFTGAAFTGALANNGIAISMDGKGAWRDNVFVERLGAVSNMRKCICGPTRASARPAHRSAEISTSTITAARIRALTARRPIKPTSTCCPSAWQPNLGRGST